ncbi:interleukin 15, like isoform X2 [Cyclopterus lumpus]|uniref:interleukin 15, like isoform X2 n=1 Tax=Cyclopterus lumpus TaxID=8103 RepID=UPI00148717A4|nr:interleukin 15, like isoform X2 [Cyclopterus lumpus]
MRGRGRSASANVHLGLICLLLLLLPPRPAARLCTQDLLLRVRNLIKKAPQQKELCSRLYTPSVLDYEKKTLGSTLKCFGEEIKVLLDEWATAGFFIYKDGGRGSEV